MKDLKLLLLSTLVPASIIIGLPSALRAASPQDNSGGTIQIQDPRKPCQRDPQSESCRISKVPDLEKRLKGAEAQLRSLQSQDSFRLWPPNLLPGLTLGAALFSLLPTLVFAAIVRELRKNDLGNVADESQRRLARLNEVIIARVDERLKQASTDIQQSVRSTAHNRANLLTVENAERNRKLLEVKERLKMLEQDVRTLRSETKNESPERHPQYSPPFSPIIDAPQKIFEDLAVSTNLQPLPDLRLDSPIVQSVSEKFGRDLDFFRSDFFKPMRATKDASQGRVNTAGASLLEFQPCAMGDASYLVFEDGHASFLIPNASLPRLVQQLNKWKLDNDSPFIIVDSSSGELQLIQPARVSSTDGVIWLVDETGTIGL